MGREETVHGTVTGVVAVTVHERGVGTYLQPRFNLRLNGHSHVVTFVTVAAHQTLLVHVREVDVIRGGIDGTGYTYVMVLYQCGAEHVFLPVETRILTVLIGLVAVEIHLGFGIQTAFHAVTLGVVGDSYVLKLHVLYGVADQIPQLVGFCGNRGSCCSL